MNVGTLTRRGFLRGSAALAGGLAIAACVAPTTTSDAEPAKEAVVLRYRHRFGRECDNHARWAQQYNEDVYPDAFVKMECFPGADYFKKLNTLIAGGTIGDAFWIPSIEGFYRLAASGASRPLDDLIAESDYNLSQLYPLNVEAASLNGKIYGLPQLAHPCRVGLFYNPGLFDEAGIDYPSDTWTYDDLLVAASELTNEEEGIYGFLPGTEYFFNLVFQRSWGGDMLNADGNQATLDSEESTAALQFISDLFHVHQVSPLPGTMEQGTYQTFAANILAMYQSGF